MTAEILQVVMAGLTEEKARPSFMELRGMLKNTYIVSTPLKKLLMENLDVQKWRLHTEEKKNIIETRE